jgi:hypothetical protein
MQGRYDTAGSERSDGVVTLAIRRDDINELDQLAEQQRSEHRARLRVSRDARVRDRMIHGFLLMGAARGGASSSLAVASGDGGRSADEEASPLVADVPNAPSGTPDEPFEDHWHGGENGQRNRGGEPQRAGSNLSGRGDRSDDCGVSGDGGDRDA